MLDKSKVKLMTKLAFYEQTQGKEDFKISEYYKKDYVGFQTLISLLWITIGYLGIVVLVLLAGLEQLLEELSAKILVAMGGSVLMGYLIVLLVYLIFCYRFYSRRHKLARERVKKYNFYLLKLLKVYEKEKE